MMRVLTYSRPNLLSKLHDELLAAGIVPIRVEGRDDDIWITVTADVNETAVAAVVAAHDPSPPIVYGGEQTMTNRVTTSGTTPATLFRATLARLTAYTAHVELMAVDAGNGNCRYIAARIVAKRLTNGAILVSNAAGQNATVLADHRDGAAGSWTVVPSVSGNDVVITCAGAASREISWFVRLRIDSFSPGGQEP